MKEYQDEIDSMCNVPRIEYKERMCPYCSRMVRFHVEDDDYKDKLLEEYKIRMAKMYKTLMSKGK